MKYREFVQTFVNQNPLYGTQTDLTNALFHAADVADSAEAQGGVSPPPPPHLPAGSSTGAI